MSKSLILKLTEEEHSLIKALAAIHQKTIKSFILSRVFEPNQKTKDAIRELIKQRSELKLYDSFDDLLADINDS
jgi:uncharacterized protein (DUF1778 family)